VQSFDRSALTGARVNRRIAIGALIAVSLLAAACSSGPNLTADQAAVTQAQHAVNSDSTALDRLQQESAKVILVCVAGHCPTGVGGTIPRAQAEKTNQVHQRLESAFQRLEAAEVKLELDESGDKGETLRR
jgi:hypothetical protein